VRREDYGLIRRGQDGGGLPALWYSARVRRNPCTFGMKRWAHHDAPLHKVWKLFDKLRASVAPLRNEEWGNGMSRQGMRINKHLIFNNKY